jgi:hypothetical protein
MLTGCSFITVSPNRKGKGMAADFKNILSYVLGKLPNKQNLIKLL